MASLFEVSADESLAGEQAPSFLIIDDCEMDRVLTERFVRDEFGKSSRIDMVSNWEDAPPAIEARNHDVYLVDHFLGAKTGLDLIQQFRESMPDGVFILLTGLDDHDIDLAASDAGASDYVPKSELSSGRLERSVRFALSMKAQKRELMETTSALESAMTALQEKADVLGTTVKTIPDGLLVLDRDLNLASYNDQFFDILGLNKQVVLSADDPGEALWQYISSLGGFGGAERDQIIGMRDGVQFECQLDNGKWIEYRGFPVERGNGWVAVFRDISRRRRLEEVKNEFVTTVSHELRTPLTSIVGSLGLVKEKAGADLRDESQQLIEIAYRNCDRLVDLVNDILDMEKLEAGKVEYVMEPLPVRKIIYEAIEANAGYGEQFGVTFEVSGEIPDLEVLGDCKGLHQVMTNLLSNASKYSPENGRVEITASCSAEFATVSVRDKGPGIAEEFQETIFEKFSKSGSDNIPGTGLGLSICRAIIDQHNGELGFDTALGKGSTFFFTLPLAQNESALISAGRAGAANA